MIRALAHFCWASTVGLCMLVHAEEVRPDSLASTAAIALKKLPREEILAAASIVTGRNTPRKPARHETNAVNVLDEIEVTARFDPAEFTRLHKPPMIQFRERLDRIRPATPAEIAKLALCIIGLCAAYGEDGAPVEDRSRTVGERNSIRTSSELAAQFRGTYQ